MGPEEAKNNVVSTSGSLEVSVAQAQGRCGQHSPPSQWCPQTESGSFLLSPSLTGSGPAPREGQFLGVPGCRLSQAKPASPWPGAAGAAEGTHTWPPGASGASAGPQ